MDHTTLVTYAVAYLATMGAVLLMFLPTIIIMALLLLLGGAIQVVIFVLRLATVGLSRSLTTLFRSSMEKLHRHGTTRHLAPH
jgi:hypothetical protein